MKKRNQSRVARSNAFAILIAGSMLLSALLACNLSNPTKCSGTVTYEGRTFTGKGKDADESQRNACNGYCLEADPDFDMRYGIWLDSPKGRAAGRPSKKESIYKDRSLLDYVTITCMKKCMARIESGELKGESKCP